MDFLNDFSKIFIEKHGKNVYDKICNQIRNEANTECKNEYIDLIFKVALMKYWGITDNNILKFIKNTINKKIDIHYMNQTHKNSINEIQEYIKIANNEK